MNLETNRIELTMGQSLKVLWSFLWRGWILLMPPMTLLMIAFFAMIPFPKPGEPPAPMDPKQMPIFFAVWFLSMALWFISQGLALRWALKASWSDFRIIAVSTKTGTETP